MFSGAELRRERKALSVPLDTVAIIAGVSSVTVSRVERGLLVPSAETIRRLLATMKLLQELAMTVSPLRIDFRDAGLLREAIDKMEHEAECRKISPLDSSKI